MSQDRVLRLIADVGGSGTLRELRDHARRQWPRDTLHEYVHDRLLKLAKWGFVTRDRTARPVVWRLTPDGRARLAQVVSA